MVDNSTVLLIGTVGTLIVILAVIIAVHQNRNATKGYRMRSLERERSQILLEQEVLNMKIAKAQALLTLEEDGNIRAMVDARNPRYVREDTTIAMNRD